ncbi:MAG: hypothetical protein GXO88_10810 [Chlorobi bacterium]|nr:hypothetical protein [Chlorobiota bacterium]
MKALKNNISKFKFLMAILLSMFYARSFSQTEIYRTNNGLLKVSTDLNKQSLVVSSKKLIIMLDYETGNFTMKQELSELITDNDSVQDMLTKLPQKFIVIKGKLDIDYVNTIQHAPIDFKVEGTILPANRQIIGSGNLVHMVEGSSAACLLSLSFTLESDDFFDREISFPLDGKIYVNVLQTLMARVND